MFNFFFFYIKRYTFQNLHERLTEIYTWMKTTNLFASTSRIIFIKLIPCNQTLMLLSSRFRRKRDSIRFWIFQFWIRFGSRLWLILLIFLPIIFKIRTMDFCSVTFSPVSRIHVLWWSSVSSRFFDLGAIVSCICILGELKHLLQKKF